MGLAMNYRLGLQGVFNLLSGLSLSLLTILFPMLTASFFNDAELAVFVFGLQIFNFVFQWNLGVWTATGKHVAQLSGRREEQNEVLIGSTLMMWAAAIFAGLVLWVLWVFGGSFEPGGMAPGARVGLGSVFSNSTLAVLVASAFLFLPLGTIQGCFWGVQDNRTVAVNGLCIRLVSLLAAYAVAANGGELWAVALCFSLGILAPNIVLHLIWFWRHSSDAAARWMVIPSRSLLTKLSAYALRLLPIRFASMTLTALPVLFLSQQTADPRMIICLGMAFSLLQLYNGTVSAISSPVLFSFAAAKSFDSLRSKNELGRLFLMGCLLSLLLAIAFFLGLLLVLPFFFDRQLADGTLSYLLPLLVANALRNGWILITMKMLAAECFFVPTKASVVESLIMFAGVYSLMSMIGVSSLFVAVIMGALANTYVFYSELRFWNRDASVGVRS